MLSGQERKKEETWRRNHYSKIWHHQSRCSCMLTSNKSERRKPSRFTLSETVPSQPTVMGYMLIDKKMKRRKEDEIDSQSHLILCNLSCMVDKKGAKQGSSATGDSPLYVCTAPIQCQLYAHKKKKVKKVSRNQLETAVDQFVC